MTVRGVASYVGGRGRGGRKGGCKGGGKDGGIQIGRRTSAGVNPGKGCCFCLS